MPRVATLLPVSSSVKVAPPLTMPSRNALALIDAPAFWVTLPPALKSNVPDCVIASSSVKLVFSV